MDITVENPQGSERGGTDTSGKPWSVKMNHHYGYIKRTTGADGDQVDVFLGANPESNYAFVVNQNDPKTGKFDEHKVMLGFNNYQEAKKAYLSNYSPGWKGFGTMLGYKMDAFKSLLNEGKFDKPVKGTRGLTAGAEAIAKTPSNKKTYGNQQDLLSNAQDNKTGSNNGLGGGPSNKRVESSTIPSQKPENKPGIGDKSPQTGNLAYNLPKNTIVGGAQEIKALAQQVLNKLIPGNLKKAVRFAIVGQEEAAKIQEATGLDVAGYKHTVDTFGIHHVFKNHGNAKNERSRGQEPITADDIALIPEIVASPDKIAFVGQDAYGNDLIKYEKRIGDTYHYVEVVRNKRLELNLETLWKTRTRETMQKPGFLTSETLGGNPPQDGSSLPHAGNPSTSPIKKAEKPEGFPEVEHTTKKGRLLKGIVLHGIKKDEAQAIDPYTFPKNGGWFIRNEHATDSVKAKYSGQSGATETLAEAKAAAPVADLAAERRKRVTETHRRKPISTDWMPSSVESWPIWARPWIRSITVPVIQLTEFVIILHTCHPVSRHKKRMTSPDYAGSLRRVVRQRFKDVPCLFYWAVAATSD